MGHLAFDVLQKIFSLLSLPLSNKTPSLLCNAYPINKSHKRSFGLTSLSSSRPLELLFSDIWTSPVLSFDGYKYYLIIIDHFTRYILYYPLKKKSQVAETFIRFKTLVENRFNTHITSFSDNGGEFTALTPFLSQHGISHLTSPPHTPEYNDIS